MTKTAVSEISCRVVALYIGKKTSRLYITAPPVKKAATGKPPDAAAVSGWNTPFSCWGDQMIIIPTVPPAPC
jgi:hypothetical protein